MYCVAQPNCSVDRLPNFFPLFWLLVAQLEFPHFSLFSKIILKFEGLPHQMCFDYSSPVQSVSAYNAYLLCTTLWVKLACKKKMLRNTACFGNRINKLTIREHSDNLNWLTVTWSALYNLSRKKAVWIWVIWKSFCGNVIYWTINKALGLNGRRAFQVEAAA